MNWIECDSCSTEFKVVSDSDDVVSFCPYCGDDIVLADEDPDEEE